MQYYYPHEGWVRVGLLSVACLVHSAQIHNHTQNASSDCWTCMSPSLSSDLTTHKSTNELDRPQPRTGLHHTHTTLPWLHFFRVHRCLELQQRSTMHPIPAIVRCWLVRCVHVHAGDRMCRPSGVSARGSTGIWKLPDGDRAALEKCRTTFASDGHQHWDNVVRAYVCVRKSV